MNGKARKLCDLMKRGIVEFVFKKKSNGKIRRAKGTLKRDLIPAEAQRKRGRPRKRPDDLVIYYDVDKKAIRSFKDYLLQKVYKNRTIDPNKETTDISKTDDDVNSAGKSKQISKQNDTSRKDEKQDKGQGDKK